MHSVVPDQAAAADALCKPPADGLRSPEPELPGTLLTCRTLGLDFTAQCQWPRCHPLDERAITVSHHLLIMAVCTRRLALELKCRHLSPAKPAPLESISASLGLHPACGSAVRIVHPATGRPARPAVLSAGTARLPALMHPAAAAVGAAAESDVMLARAPPARLVIVPRDPGQQPPA